VTSLTALASTLLLISFHTPQPPSLPIWVEAGPKTAYFAKCHIRTFRDPYGVYGNTFYLDRKGPLRDRIPSPNAQCVMAKTRGPGLVTLHIFKDGDHAVTVDEPNRWMRLNVW
jgi:hypothetical protein